MPESSQRLIAPEDLYDLQIVTDCQISPDGRHVVYAVQRVDRETEDKYANLWIVPAEGGDPTQFTYGDQVDSQPRWSPDGSQIAFLSTRVDKKHRSGKKQPQMYVIPFSGGEARPLTDLQGEYGPFEWSPDGQRLVCQFRAKDAEAIEREEDEDKKKLGVISRHITRVFYKSDGEGFLPKERWHIWIIDAQTGQATPLTACEVYDEVEPRWSPDGSQIAFCSNRSADPDLDPDAVDLFLAPVQAGGRPVEGGELRKVETPLGPKSDPSWSPDGTRLAYLGSQGRERWWSNTSLWVVPVSGGGQARNLTAAHDLHASSNTINDLPGGLPMTSPTWSADGRRLFFLVSRHGSTVLQALDVEGSDPGPETVIGGPGVVGAFSLDREQSRFAYLRADMREPAQVWVCGVDGGGAHKRTRVNADLLQARDLGEVEEVWFKGPDDNDLHGWILKPPGFDPTRTYPAILEIHGGPTAQYGHLFMHEFYVLAARGYVVFFCNPRSSQGYGEEHCRVAFNHFGTVDYRDLMAWADRVQGKPYVDADRMGVTGGSYGGLMTNWIIGHTARFRAAVTQRSVSNWVSFYGSSDANWSFQAFLGGEAPWENLENYWRQSPMEAIANATTPTLVIHSEQDMRVPLEQGEQVYVALKKKGIDAELVLFPDESHGLSRGGRTDRRVVRLKHILRWFDRYLK
jgi:dipeptidyl aminopeptidase/acylaminoacyl peptidase